MDYAAVKAQMTDTRHPQEILDEKSRSQANADAAASYAKPDFYKTPEGRAAAQKAATIDAAALKKHMTGGD